MAGTHFPELKGTERDMDHLTELVRQPRSSLLMDILKALDDEALLRIMYLHAYHESANERNLQLLKRDRRSRSRSMSLSDEKQREQAQLDQEQEQKGQLTADALDKLNTLNALNS